LLRGFAAGHRCRLPHRIGNMRLHAIVKIRGQFSRQTAAQLSGQCRVIFCVGVKPRLPVCLPALAFFFRVPLPVNCVRDGKGRMRPAQRGAGGGNFLRAQRGTVGFFRACQRGCAFAYHRAAANQRGCVVRFGLGNRLVNRVDVMPIHPANHLPAVALEALGRIVAKPVRNRAVYGNAVVVVQHNQARQLQGAGQRADLMRNAFHQAAIAHKGVSVMVDEAVPGAVELRRQQGLGQRHAHRVGQSLPQRAGGRFHTRRDAKLRMAGCGRVQLAKAFDVFYRQCVARQMQHRVQQHGGMAVGQHETVAPRPGGVSGVMAQMPREQRSRHFRHAHGCARVP